MKRNHTTWAAAVAMALTSTFGAHAKTTYILPLGDSITQGGRSDRAEYTYRYPLYYQLKNAGYDVDFVGSLNGGLSGDAKWPAQNGVDFDLDHEGHYGWKTAAVRDNIKQWSQKWPAAPDIALIHLGTNDQDSKNIDADIVQPLKEIVAALREKNPRVAVFIGHLNFNGGNALVIRPLVEAMAKSISTKASPVATVNHYLGWIEDPKQTGSDTFDWAHPNPQGQAKMATKWFAAMKPLLVASNAAASSSKTPVSKTSKPSVKKPSAFSWQSPQSQVLPNGDLKWTPRPFVFRPGKSVRYIDYATGNDSNNGTSKTTPWKHHPWDSDATGIASSTRGAHTYVFKRGVIYRGALNPRQDRGEAGNPIQLTSDPTWGTGQAQIVGSETVTDWTRASHPKMPQGTKVWMKEVDYLPRSLWSITKDGTATRLNLARMNNWSEPDPNDVMSEWPTWENPEWWRDGNKGYDMKVGERTLHLGIDTKNFTGKAEDYVGATVWTEWGIVMGSPYPAKVEAFDEKQRAVAFRGPWTFDKLENIIKGNRYYLENKPQWLDEPGEFWVEKVGNRGRIYARFPADADPKSLTVEAGRHVNMLDATQLNHLRISGLTFRFSNVAWDYNDPSWSNPDIQGAVLRLNGTGDDIEVNNCRFEHVNIPIRFNARDGDLGRIKINDNVVRFTDHGAFYVDAGAPSSTRSNNVPVKNVEMLRNNLYHIGWRIVSGEHGHAINVTYPETSHVAGNFLYRIAGWGIAVTGGKNSGVADVEAPLSRHLIHNNRVQDVLLKSNDWGGIETWQGGPFYVYNNLVINPVAFKNWTFNPSDPNTIGSFGHAYYLDGSFKNYLFNNIAQGRNNTLGTKGTNTTALQNIFSFENSFFHNTFTRFVETTRQQEPSAGRTRYLSNVMTDSSKLLLRHSDPSEGAPDPNASHYTQGGKFAYDKLAMHHNVFYDIKGKFGVFEETGAVYPTLESMRTSLMRLKPQAGDIGVMAKKAPLVASEKGDFRPAPGSEAIGMGSRVWVPWSLFAVAGEWNFTRNNLKPGEVMDEHWFMTRNYDRRESYKSTPRYPLAGRNITAASYAKGVLEDWTEGALKLNGRDQYLMVENARLSGDAKARTVNMDTNNFLIEAVIQTSATEGTIVAKADAKTGYVLDLVGGKPRLRLMSSGATSTTSTARVINDGKWHHVVAEVDRKKGVALYVDGKKLVTSTSGAVPTTSLTNSADFLVGGGTGQKPFAGSFDFLRLSRGTLADAHTSIAELFAWQFNGPQLSDFAGNNRKTQNAAGALAR